MKRLISGIAAALLAISAGATTLAPVQLLNPAGSTSGQAILSTGASTAPAWGNVSAAALTGVTPVANGGTNCAAASGTCLDNIAGFASTGFLTRTGAGTYAFQSATNGITLGNLAQAAANTLLGNATGSTANVAAVSVTGCNGAAQALQWTNGSGFGCNSALATSGANANITSLSGLTTPLSVSQGGIGVGTLAADGVLFGNGTSAIGATAVGTSGQVLTSNGTGVAPTFQTASGRLLNVQVFTSSGTYTPTSGTASIIVEAVGGGGGGGGVAATGAGQSAAAAGGSAGAYAKALITSGFSGAAVTIGAAGAGGVAGANTGATGGATSFGTFISCPGGPGGLGGSAVSAASIANGGGASGGATISGATQLNNVPGTSGMPGVVIGAGVASYGGQGGALLYGSQAQTKIGSGAGNGGLGFGSGGGGANAAASQAAAAGGSATAGVVIVYEYR